MEIKPILSSMRCNKGSSILIILQVAFTLMLVSNALFMAGRMKQNLDRPSGMDPHEGDLIVVYPASFATDFNIPLAIRDDLQELRTLPGVRAATPMSDIPLSGGGSSSMLHTGFAEDSLEVHYAYYTVDEQGLETLGVKLLAGRNFRPEEVAFHHVNSDRVQQSVLLSRTVADKLFPQGDAVGKQLWHSPGKGPVTVIGVYEHLQTPWPHWKKLLNHSAIFAEFYYRQGGDPAYVIRTDAGKADVLVPQIEELLGKTSGRIIHKISPFREIKAQTYMLDIIAMKLLRFVVVILLVITGLGIVGLTSFTISKRRKQIGTRRALGARKIDILRYFLLENSLMTTIGIVLGCVLAYSLNYALVNKLAVDPMQWGYVVVTIIMLWLLGPLAVWAPAKRASEIEPAIATRSV